jgi:hypothetical protein
MKLKRIAIKSIINYFFIIYAIYDFSFLKIEMWKVGLMFLLLFLTLTQLGA